MAVIIILDSEGGVFFKGVRVGKDGIPFKIFKFRSMHKNSEGKGNWSVSDNDSRITRVGHFIRNTKIDEIPQLINILRGEMSFVGPRPEVQYWVNMYNEEEKRILDIKPGMTDWASIVYFDQFAYLENGNDTDEIYFRQIRPLKLKLQLYYSRHNSIITDGEIILWTIYKVMFRKKVLPNKVNKIINEHDINMNYIEFSEMKYKPS